MIKYESITSRISTTRCILMDSNPSIQRRYITIWVFTCSMYYLHHNKYKLNSSQSEWTRYIPIISSTIYLGQMKNRCHKKFKALFVFQNHLIKFPSFKNSQNRVCSLFFCQWNLYFHLFECLVSTFKSIK